MLKLEMWPITHLFLLLAPSWASPGSVVSGTTVSSTQSITDGELSLLSAFTVPAAFPTSVFQNYYGL